MKAASRLSNKVVDSPVTPTDGSLDALPEENREAASPPNTFSFETSPTKQNLWHRWRQLKLWQQFLIGVLVLLAVGGVGVGLYLRSAYQRVFVGGGKPLPNQTEEPAASPPPPVYTFALLGHGGAGHDGALLTDSIMVVKLDTGSKQIAMISVPRDLWVSLPVEGYDKPSYWKVNAAYAIGASDHIYRLKPEEFTGDAGGGAMSKYALEKIVGFPIQYFVAIDFNGFRKTIDAIGGVKVNVEQTFDDYQYPIPGKEDDPCGKTEEEIAALTATLSATLLEKEFLCRYEHLHFDRGINYLDAETALKFVRSRHSAQSGGDFNRAARQRAVLLAFKDKVLAIDFIPKMLPLINSLSYNLKTDIPVSQLTAWLDEYQQFLDYDIVGVALTADEDNVLELTYSADRQSIIVPKQRANLDDWSSVHTFIQDQLTKAQEATNEAELAE